MKHSIMKDSAIKILIAYYSRKGQNYFGGRILDLKVGNTEVIANKIQALTGGDLFEIQTIKPYPEDYDETTRVAQNELRSNARPELTEYVENINTYDVIYLGFPNWWGTFPMGVFTFLETYDFSGKTIIPFCTHEGSGMGHSERDIQKLCPHSKVQPGIAIRGSNVNSAGKQVESWLNK
ncbi:MAG: flavodoxin [Paludibacter sp.]